MIFTRKQLEIVCAFLAQVRERASITKEEWWDAYQSWAPGARAWSRVYGFAGTDISTALWWYQYRYMPGSKEWRPPRILQALIAASERDYVEPERIEPNDAALRSTPADKRKARLVFIKKYDVATYYQKVNPILAAPRRGGVEALFAAPATTETREYVRILAEIAGGHNLTEYHHEKGISAYEHQRS